MDNLDKNNNNNDAVNPPAKPQEDKTNPTAEYSSMRVLFSDYFEKDKQPDKVDGDKKEEPPKKADMPSAKNQQEPVQTDKNQASPNDNKSAHDTSEPKQSDSNIPPDDKRSSPPPAGDNNDETKRIQLQKEFIEELKKDVGSAWRKYEKELNLPSIEVLQQIMKTTPTDETSIKNELKNFQKKLKEEIEKEFNLDPGTFRYDADEAVDPESPSYAYLVKSRQFEEGLRGEIQKKLQFAEEQQKQMRKLQEEDKKWFAETFYPDNPAKADEAVKELSLLPAKILKGEAPAHKHPFSLRTMLLGVYFDELAERIRKETEQKITKAFEEQGMFLSKKKAPDELNKLAKGTDEGHKSRTTTPSPMENYVNSFLFNNS